MSRKQKASQQSSINETYSRLSLRAISAAFFIGIAAILPLYMTNYGYVIMTKQKADVFIMFTAIAAIASVIAVFLTTSRFQLKNYFTEGEPPRQVTISEWALLIFILLTLLSAVFSPWQDVVWSGFTRNGYHGRWEGFWAFLCYVLAFFIISRFYQPKRLHFLIFAGSAMLVCLYGFLQFLGYDILENVGFFLFPVEPPFEPLTRAFRTTLGNTNVVAGYCSLVSVLFAALFAGENSKWGFFYLAASAMAFAMLMVSQGDSGKIGVLGAMVLLVPYWVSERRRLGKLLLALSSWSVVYASHQGYLTLLKRRAEEIPVTPGDQYFLTVFDPRSTLIFAALAVLLLCLGLCLLRFVKKWPGRGIKIAGATFLAVSIISGVLFIETAGSRLSHQPNNIIWQAREVMHGRIDDSFGSNRGWVWRNGMGVIMDNPFLGTGPDTFFFALGGRQISIEPTEANPLPDIVIPAGRQLHGIAVTGTWFDKAHNTFLQIAVCMGIPALLAYLVFLGGLFSRAAKKAFDRPLLLAFGAASLSYLIQSFFQVDTPIDRPMLYVALGVMSGELWRERIGA